MRIIVLLILHIALLVPVHLSWGTDFTGFWRTDCSDGHGIQIKPAGNESYSVSFCGPGGCFDPGTWTPNTRIEGDQKYKIISPGELRIKRTDNGDFFVYKRCTSDPTWITTEAERTELGKSTDCSFVSSSKEEGVIIAWVTDVREFTEFGKEIKTQAVTVGSFRPFALLSATGLQEIPGATIHKGQSFWRVLSPASSPLKLTSVGSFFDHLVDYCSYFGTLDKPNLPRWTLLSSKPLPGVFLAPSNKDRAEFHRLNTSCVIQGDYLEGQAPPCTRPKLLTVSDINKNGKPEYWATEPYVWDTGVTVWESNSGKLVKLLEVCVGCAD